MLESLRRRLSYANVTATLALFIALGGTSYAAVKITGKNVKDGTLTGKDVRERSLLAGDFKTGQLPAGERGDTGAAGQQGLTGVAGGPGPQGEKGDTGATGPEGSAGEAGGPGPQGEKGDTGDVGQEGDAGPTGPHGDTGDAGPIGPQGRAGDTGAEGPGFTWRRTWNPLTPYLARDVVERNGSSFTALAANTNADPAVSSSAWGLMAARGEQGATGLQGDVGPIGPQGENGPEGPQGEMGPQGSQGETGAEGAEGPEGDVGPSGPTGETGATGPAGLTSAIKFRQSSVSNQPNGQRRPILITSGLAPGNYLVTFSMYLVQEQRYECGVAYGSSINSIGLVAYDTANSGGNPDTMTATGVMEVYSGASNTPVVYCNGLTADWEASNIEVTFIKIDTFSYGTNG